MTAPFRKMSDVLTSEQSMSCMDMIPCYARFLSPLHLQSRGCRHRDIHFVFCRLSSHQPAGSPPAGGPGRTGGEKEEQKTNSGSVCGTVTMIQ